MGATAHATDFTVSNLSDGPLSGPAGSLRKAISDANANAGADRILFDSSLSGTINLTNGSLQITETLDVQGPGADKIRVDGYQDYSAGLFTVNPDVGGDPVTISGLSLAYGDSGGPGGAILNDDAKLTVADDFIFANTSSGIGQGGGAIADLGGYASGTQTVIRNTTITGNSTTSGSGGGVWAGAQVGSVINSTIAGNYARVDGGGVFGTNNGADFQDATVAGNYAYGLGGGVANGTGGPDTSFLNTIVGDNVARLGRNDLSGTDPFDADFSLIENTSGITLNSSVSGSNVEGIDPQFPNYLTFSGGTTPTLVPDYTSPVIDKGKTAGGVTTDQRGFTRPLDLAGFPNSGATGADGADMGAVEETVNETTPADLTLGIIDTPDPVTVGDPLSYAFKVTNDGPNPATGVSMTALIPASLALNTSSLSGNCHVAATVPGYGTYVDCSFGSIGNGGSKTENATVTPLDSAAIAPYVSTYAGVSGDQVDPNTYGNFAYADTVVRRKPAPPSATPPVGESGVAAAIRRCKKKFHGKKRKKCIKRAKGHASASVERRWRAVPRVHPFTKRPRPRGIEPVGRSRLERLSDR